MDCGAPMGRGVFTTKEFKQNDIVIDYHGVEVPLGRSTTVESYCDEDPDNRDSSYIIEITKGQRRLLDASIDPCVIHHGRRCLGRLINHANEKDRGTSNRDCNLRLNDIPLNFLSATENPTNKRVVALVATRDIQIGEQLFFDYGDRDAREAFANTTIAPEDASINASQNVCPQDL